MGAHRLAALWLGVGLAGVGVAGVGLAGCGRIGYDETALDGGDGPPEIDAPDGLAVCNTAVRVTTLPVPTGKQIVALDLAATSTGFVVVWPVDDEIWTTGLAVSAGPQLDVIQPGVSVAPIATSHVSIDAMGDDTVLGLDNPDAGAIYFLPLDERGEQRSKTKSHENVRAHGASFVVAEPDDGSGLYGVAGVTGNDTVAFERDPDSHPIIDGQPALPGLVPETASLSRLHDGWAVVAGTNECHLAALDDALVPIGSPQVIQMTCHNATLATHPVTSRVMAAWNCDNDQVWITAGVLDGSLPGHLSVFGDADHVSSNPRLAFTPAGLWYAFAVDGGRLGRALLDDDGAPIPSVTAAIVVPADAGPFDLLTRADDAYLFWIAPANELWTMRLCAP